MYRMCWKLIEDGEDAEVSKGRWHTNEKIVDFAVDKANAEYAGVWIHWKETKKD